MALSIAASDGGATTRPSGPNPHRLTSGPIVASNAPPLVRLIAQDCSSAAQSAFDTPIQSTDSDAFKADSSESARHVEASEST